MLDLESPPLRTVRTLHQEKRLRKRRELDALVRESGGRRRRTGGREELLYGEEETSSDDSGPGRTHEAGGVTVWRPSHQVRRRGVVWLGVRWGLAMGLVIFMGSLSVWLHLHTRTEIEAVRRQLARVSDQYEDLPDTLLHIQARLESVETNQSQVLVSINKIFQSVSELETKLQDFNTRLQSSVGGEKFSQRFSELDLKVSEIRAGLHSVKNSTSINTRSLGNLSLTLSQIKVDNFGSDSISTDKILSPMSESTTKTSLKSSNSQKVVQTSTRRVREN